MEKHVRLIRDVFTHYGMDIETDAGNGYDFSAADDKYSYVVTVKMPKNPTVGILQLEPIIRDLLKAAEQEEKTPILVIGAVMRRQRKALKKYESLVLIDIQNLLYMVQNQNDQKLELLSALEYSVDLLLPEKPDLAIDAPILLTSPDDPGYEDSDEIRAKNRLDGLITLLSDWDRVSTESTDYEDVCCNAAREEIIRRYYYALCNLAEKGANEHEVNKISLILKQAKLTTEYRRTTVAAREMKELYGVPASAIELQDGTIITARTSSLLGPSAALILNATKHLAGIPHEVKLIPQEMIEPIQKTKVDYLHGHNPRLHTDEVLVALSMLSIKDENCRKALEQLPKFDGCQVHSTVMLSEVDRKIFKKLGVGLTCDPVKKGE